MEAQGMKIPLTMNLDFSTREIDGTVSAGSFGSFPVSGNKKE